ncbi:hypothetical protein BU16DRAFT_562222 [Lophium mytilinum]|uniref:Uncharacterized protein n=1 Tax=Lophium mytilinum TaxID=390894 RepID=A0A6A6QQ69_9PEZI|nr:hypothetical protein BU16DRAFT_562222 [Lophium mytilinum]
MSMTSNNGTAKSRLKNWFTAKSSAEPPALSLSQQILPAPDLHPLDTPAFNASRVDEQRNAAGLQRSNANVTSFQNPSTVETPLRTSSNVTGGQDMQNVLENLKISYETAKLRYEKEGIELQNAEQRVRDMQGRMEDVKNAWHDAEKRKLAAETEMRGAEGEVHWLEIRTRLSEAYMGEVSSRKIRAAAEMDMINFDFETKREERARALGQEHTCLIAVDGIYP